MFYVALAREVVMGAGRWILVLACWGVSCTPSTGLERADVENYDADHRLRAWRHSRGYDTSWVSPRMSHVVRLEFEFEDCGGSRRPSSCTATLVAPDLVLTAAHCVVGTRFIDAQTCNPPTGPAAAPIAVLFDDQTILNSAVLDRRGTVRTSFEPLNHVIGIGAVHDETFFTVDKGGGAPCCTARPQYDMVLLRLERPVMSRGFAAIRVPASDPAAGQLLPVIHHPGRRPKQIAVSEIRATPPLLRPLITLFTTDAAAASASASLALGSSGAPLFDEEGYVIGVYSHDCGIAGGCDAFAPVRENAAALGSAVAIATESSSSALGRFAGTPLVAFSMRAVDFGALPERPLAVVRRTDGGFVTAGYATDAAGSHVFALAGFDAGGEVDGSFGADGRVVDDIADSRDDELVDLAVQRFGGDDRLVGVGNLAGPPDVVVARYDTAGARDVTFASSGLQHLSMPSGSFVPHGAAITVDPADGSIVVAGDVGVPLPRFENRPFGSPFVARLQPDGSPDPDCGVNGTFTWRPVAQFDPPTEGQLGPLLDLLSRAAVETYEMAVRDVTIDNAGRILLAGYLTFGDFRGRAAWVGRLMGDCRPDGSFGPNGSGVAVVPTRSFAPLAENHWASAVLTDPATGRILVGGTWSHFQSTLGIFGGGMFVAALSTDGSLDTSFGFGVSPGGALVPQEGWHDEAYGMAMSSIMGQPFVVLAGESYRQEVAPRRARRPRVALVSTDGILLAHARPVPPAGIVEAWATDVVLGPSDTPVLALAVQAP